MRAPLHLALLISPIYLLMPVQLFKRAYNRQTMMNISRSLGNDKPEALLNVEMAIWKTLLSLASGSLDPLDLLQRLSDELPWERIKSALSTDSNCAWFSLGKNLLISNCCNIYSPHLELNTPPLLAPGSHRVTRG